MEPWQKILVTRRLIAMGAIIGLVAAGAIGTPTWAQMDLEDPSGPNHVGVATSFAPSWEDVRLPPAPPGDSEDAPHASKDAPQTSG